MEKLETLSQVKVVLSFRIFPHVKIHLASEASKLGVTLSDHCEALIMNGYNKSNEIMQLRKELNEKHQQFFAQALELNTIKAANNETTQLPIVASLLKPEEQIDDLLENPQLLKLFKQLEGTVDNIPLPSGKKFQIVYKTPKDVLLGMIYSFQVTK